VRALGASDRNDIGLSTIASTTGTTTLTRVADANLTIHTLTSADRGDITLNVQGTVKRATAGSSAILADNLTVLADAVVTAGSNAIELNTQARVLQLETRRVGQIWVAQGDRSVVVEATKVDNGSFTLTGAGFHVVEAVDGQDAFEKAQTHHIDRVLTDQNMPRLDGLGLTKKLRESTKFKTTPILILTTESSDAMKQAGRAAGATGWLVKPFDPNRLIEIIQKVIK
jgi:two-component system chemotaxis response regulator CheY